MSSSEIIKTLVEISEDAAVVEGVRWWLEQEEGHRLCPLTRDTVISRECDKLCHKIWPFLKDEPRAKTETDIIATCPCGHRNLPVEIAFQIIVDMAALQKTSKKTFKRGDIVKVYDQLHRICIVDDNTVALCTVDGMKFADPPTEVEDAEAVTSDDLPSLEECEYIGHSDEIATKGNEIIVVEWHLCRDYPFWDNIKVGTKIEIVNCDYLGNSIATVIDKIDGNKTAVVETSSGKRAWYPNSSKGKVRIL